MTHGVPDPQPRPAVLPTTFGTAKTQSAPTPAAASPTADGGGSGTPAYSTTNVQEAGVDEPDVVKTDGGTIFTASQGRLFAVGISRGAPQLLGTLNLGPMGYQAQLLLRGTRLIVIMGSAPIAIQPLPVGGPAAAVSSVAPSPYHDRASTTVEEVDVSNPSAMHVTRTMTVDGSFVDARQNGATARLVIASAPPAIAQAGLRARASGWIPRRTFHSALTGRRYARPVAGCAAIARPAQFSGLGMLTILTLNLDRGLWTAGSDALMADAQVVYGSTQSLYVATQKWIPPQTAPDRIPAQTTVIDRFDATSPDRTPLSASGEVPGYLLNQFSLSEYKGYLRVATTSSPSWWGGPVPQSQAPPQSQSFVTVLATQGGVLAPAGQVGGLGMGQKIYSVRFVDDAGYVVTFRQIDPLYTLDLSSPSAPKVAGQLELEGYSSYLHPLGNGLLLGVGQVVGANEPSGAQLELFDVSAPATPKLLARTLLGGGSSTGVQYDHHAFLFWPPTKLAVLPLQIYPQPSCGPSPAAPPQNTGTAAPADGGTCSSGPSAQGFTGAIGFSIDRGGISELGRVTHDATGGYSPPILRSVVVGDRLFTISAAGVVASRLDTLARTAAAAFPQPAPPKPGSSGAGTGTATPGQIAPAKPAGG